MKNIVQTIFIIICLMLFMYPFYTVAERIIPLRIVKQTNTIERNLKELGAEPVHIKKISNAIQVASEQTGISHQMITALMYTESRFKPAAVSTIPKYKGLMQIPYDIKYVDANVLIGARILQDHIKYADGNVRKAICNYKGWQYSSPKGRAQADKVLKIYKNLT